MKKSLLVLLLSLCALGTRAQVDAQFNFVNLMLFEASGSVEAALNDNVSFGGFTGYHYGLPNGIDEIHPGIDNQGGENEFFYIGPELKYYVYPKDKIDRFYLGVYARYSVGKATSADDGTYDINGNWISRTYSSTYNKVAFGISLGSKWVTRNNIVFGVSGGIDRNLLAIYADEEYLDHTPGGSDDENFGFRLGLSIGYRFD
ncbi:hypothetical protein BFP72_10790 [Reichenbachiella sp. 5M10]|uniref:DUF3575 domain-containing protein n=1 Tax=Reichenbachiella sp. 5M10 TaxID=1889772 RepID=UPI000C153166|nr:DUF3575 domain-containing protein [Reichenbachiella sp. 5M10]PIB35844.1 hypothetical protein BFP72_10790 [Reichenbachiella sp. 5M10]